MYNLFPRHFRRIEEWIGVLDHAAKMGFNLLFVNPFHQTGFSGSLYAVKDYYKLNPLFLAPGSDPCDWSPLEEFIEQCGKRDIRVVMDLVINHTAIDSVLIEQHPDWYLRDEKGKVKSPYAIDPGDASKVTIWGDLAEIDTLNSPDRQSLWKYFDDLVAFFQEMGIYTYRCDAAYQVPAELWSYLISRAKRRNAETRFLAETLGCRLEEIEALADAGFDYLFNSSKWWNFDEPWALEQHEANGRIAPSFSFPESHDTQRLAEESGGKLSEQKARYLFAALFSEGLLMPMGYEYGARNRMDVVKGTPEDAKETIAWNLTDWISQINAIKKSTPVLKEEGHWETIGTLEQNPVFLRKSSDNGAASVIIGINKQDNPWELHSNDVPDEVKGKKMIRPFHDPQTVETMTGPIALTDREIVVWFE
ncbi:MAG: alpha-amylase family glycosyl hydrolase [Chitinispirillaceae bacterium]